MRASVVRSGTFHTQYRDMTWPDITERTAKAAYAMAELGPADLDLVELHDAFSIAERIVVITSRDGLGWPSRPDLAAQSGALVSAARSLALQLGRAGTTVNVVAALPPEGSPLRDAGRPENTHLYEPEALTPEPVTVHDIAETVAFFLDSRSSYITGQVLNCCGGASLLSSLSV